jgi:hypothetical protein
MRHGATVPVPAAVPAQLRNRFFRGSKAVEAGLLTPDQLRSTAWRQLFRDVYVHRDVPDSHEVRARAAATVLVTGAVVSGRSVAVLWGVDLAGPQDVVELTVPAGAPRCRVRGVRVRRRSLPSDGLCRRRGVATTTPGTTALDVAATFPGDEAVVAVDRMLAAGIVDLGPLRSPAAAARGPGSVRVRAVLSLADEQAASPQETRLGLLILRSGLPAPVAQHRVLADGRFVARVDFAWPDRRVAVEYDGLWHAEPGQFARDRQRLNRLHAAGCTVVHATAADLRHPAELLARLAVLLR